MKSKMVLAVISISIILSLVAVPAGATSISDWNDFYDTMNEDEDSVSMFASSAYDVAIDPEYVGIDMSIQALSDVVDTWISIGLLETAEEALEVLDASPKGIFIMLRNAGGRLSVSLYNTGMSETYFENVVTDIEFINEDLMIEWVQNEEDSTWSLYINKNKVSEDISLDSIVAEHFTNEDGKTFVSFAAFDAGAEGQHHEMRSWTVNSIVDEAEELPVEETPEPTVEPEESETPDPTEEPSNDEDDQLAPPAEDTTPEPEGSGMLLVGIIMAAIIVIGVIAVLAVKRKKQ